MVPESDAQSVGHGATLLLQNELSLANSDDELLFLMQNDELSSAN